MAHTAHTTAHITDILSFFLVVSFRDEDSLCSPGYTVLHSNAGKNGNEDNYSYRTMRGAIKRMEEHTDTDPDRAFVIEVKGTLLDERDQEPLRDRALNAAKRWGFEPLPYLP